ncbi:MAG TPA: hypothetical protein VNZ63_08135 [Verrucomicrobiae bacterium]|jgi:hypothetical protein|nr:hypothetical protein [Verrucomicrobiae bacterium]
MDRPGGVTLLAVLSFLLSFLAALQALPGLLPLGTLSFLPRVTAMVLYLLGRIEGCGSHALGALAVFLQIRMNLIFVPYLVIAVLYGAIGLGLLKLQNWARWLVIALCILELIGAAVGYSVPRFLLLRLGILGMAIDVAVLIFLFQPKVKEVFDAGAT